MTVRSGRIGGARAGRERAEEEGPSPPPPPSQALAGDLLAAKLDAERAELRRAAAHAGIGENEPMRPLIASLDRLMGMLGQTVGAHTAALGKLLVEAREAAQTEIDRAKASSESVEAAIVPRIAAELGRTLDASMIQRARAEERRINLTLAGIALVVLVLVGGGAYILGTWSASPCRVGGEIRQVPTGERYCVLTEWLDRPPRAAQAR